MKLQVNDTKVISVCKTTKRSKWANNTFRGTDVGMQEVVTITKNNKGQKVSTTSYVAP